jgi:hypothetical protein
VLDSRWENVSFDSENLKVRGLRTVVEYEYEDRVFQSKRPILVEEVDELGG